MRRKPDTASREDLQRGRVNFTISNMVMDALYEESSRTMIPMSRIVEAGIIEYINRQRRARAKLPMTSASVPT